MLRIYTYKIISRIIKERSIQGEHYVLQPDFFTLKTYFQVQDELSDAILLHIHIWVGGEVINLKGLVRWVSNELSEDLLNRAYSLMPGYNKNTVIETALKEFIQKRERKDLRDLRGKIKFEEGYDYKAMREDSDILL